MDKKKLKDKAQTCSEMIREIDFKSLPISQYNREYIEHLLPTLEYYFKIYIDSVSILLKKKNPDGLIVDFGGGHGFLSLFLKKLGFKVIYCDYNPLSVKTIALLAEKLGFGPDHIVEGTSTDLLAYCRVNKLKPSYLIATDLIEHVYDLDLFFADLFQINPGFKMVFTTGSNPCNPYKVRNLRKIMTEVEKQYFLPMRQEFIQNNYPELPEEEIIRLAILTRGLTYKDIAGKVDTYNKKHILPEVIQDKYNTCDPQSGNWTERMLPLKSYRKILSSNGFKVEFKKGYYNEQRNNPFASFIIKTLNVSIKYSGFIGRIPAAYLILRIEGKK